MKLKLLIEAFLIWHFCHQFLLSVINLIVCLDLTSRQVGDTVGVMRKEDGSLHFFVNSTDLGCAAQGVPANVYGVIDLFGQCAQVTIVSGSEEIVEAELTNTMNGKTAFH